MRSLFIIYMELYLGYPIPKSLFLDDYGTFKYREMLFEILKKDFATSTVLYVGYSNKDSNWRTVFDEIKTEFYPSKLPPSYRITPDKDEVATEILDASGIETINITLEEFCTAAKIELTNVKIDNESLIQN